MATVIIKGCRPAQPPMILNWWRPTLELTGAPAQDPEPAGGGGMEAAP